MKITILFGTETGNAEMLAEDIHSHLEADHDVSCHDLAEIDPAGLNGETFLVIVCSTYGDGDLPSSAQPFAEKLEAGAYDLSSVRFAVFGLGDAEYAETFAHGSMKLAEKLCRHGAVQIGNRPTHNASGTDMPEDLALPWVAEVLAEASTEMAS